MKSIMALAPRMPRRERSVKKGCAAIALAWAACAAPHAVAGDLNSPFALETAETLPANVRNPRFINIYSSVTEKFGGGGVGEGLGTPLIKPVTGAKMAEETLRQDGAAKAALLKGLLHANGLRDEALIGMTTGQVNTFADVKVAALAWGITDRFTLAGVLPIIHVDVNASTGFVTAGDGTNYQRFQTALARSSSPALAQETTGQLNDSVNRKLLRLGYDPIQSYQSFSGIGDAQLIGKYRLHDDGVNAVALKGTLVFPTGTTADPDRALDIPLGEGTLGAGLAAIYDRKLPLGLRWDSYGSYLMMAPHHLTKRLPLSEDDSLSSDKDNNVYQDARSRFALGTGIDHLFPSIGLIVGGGYAYQFMTRAQYSGSAFAADRYELLSDLQPMEDLHSVVASAAFSTIDWYKNKKFVYPMQVGFSYSHPLAGRNVPAGDLVSGELIVFF